MFLSNFLKNTSSNNATAVTLSLVKLLGVRVSRTSVINSVEEHPDYPSLLSISDSLKRWKIENLSLQVEPDKLDVLPLPFIAHTKSGGDHFELITSVNGTVRSINANGKEQDKTREEFVKGWSGVVLLAGANEHSGEKGFRTSQKKERLNSVRIPSILLSCILFCAVFFFSTFRPGSISTVAPGILLFLKLIGCVIASLLLWFEIDRSNPVLKQICSGGKSSSCEAVLNSKGSKLFGGISWSEVGFFYFAGSFIFLLSSSTTMSLPKGDLSTLLLLSWLNLFALPYTFFSIFYQWRIAKQWCPLCLVVQGLLLTEAVVLYFGYWHQPTAQPFDYLTLLIAATSFALPLFFWLFAKPFLLKAQKTERLIKELARLKYNPEIFGALLAKQKTIIASADGLGILVGNPSASNTIIKVCNPYCGPCANAHTVIDEILENNENVNVQIIFTATDDEADKRAKPVKHLLALHEKGDRPLIEAALNAWYGADKKDYDVFAGKYIMNGELQKQGEKVAAMDAWCKEMNIEATPTFFINGHRLPEVYKVDDLKYLLT